MKLAFIKFPEFDQDNVIIRNRNSWGDYSFGIQIIKESNEDKEGIFQAAHIQYKEYWLDMPAYKILVHESNHSYINFKSCQTLVGIVRPHSKSSVKHDDKDYVYMHNLINIVLELSPTQVAVTDNLVLEYLQPCYKWWISSHTGFYYSEFYSF